MPEQVNDKKYGITINKKLVVAEMPVNERVSEEKSKPDNYLKNTEMAVEGNYDMIDGIINNGSKEENMTALFTIKMFDEERNYKCNNLTANDILHIVANSTRPFVELTNYCQRIDEVEYAEIQQSNKFKFSLDIDLNDKSVHIFAVNDGKGGIAECDRNYGNTISKDVMIDNFIDTLTVSDLKTENQNKKTFSLGINNLKKSAKRISEKKPENTNRDKTKGKDENSI